ncbi:hypothetical protein QR680_001475 [Steinernema hermaphroditum]|uniref:hydroxyacid-oxoacid transhydrogenase n=1 Tax=Steinernema hermaphroditum TaxID=289476 RepID=A0AA39GYG1_9BILA|nr:hypothetical protein QR680_001475 [Steinernema hermaphroditum]
MSSVGQRATVARNLLRRLAKSKQCCPHHAAGGDGPICVARKVGNSTKANTDYAFEMVCSTLRFGRGVTAEIGYDMQNLGVKNTLIITDRWVSKTRAFKEVADSLTRQKIPFTVFDNVKVEPSDKSMREAVDFARNAKSDSFIAVGGGSVMDTAKAAALLTSNPKNDFLDFVALPFGKQLVPKNPMLPLIAVPTTAGTGSETTGVAILDLPEKNCKTGLRHRCLKPLLAIIDPLNVMSMPRNVAIYSGFDVLCHALESYTARPYNQRSPRPQRPELRPVYQGSNPVSDVWAREALTIISKYFRRAVNDPDDEEARTEMLKASSFAGMGFGNAGVHLCHGLSYPISSQGKSYVDKDYDQNAPLIPHGLSVVTTAVADFLFTTDADPHRHANAARFLGSDIPLSADNEYIAQSLADQIRGFMSDFGVPNGLSALGFSRGDCTKLASAAVNSLSAVQIAPKDTDKDVIEGIYERSLNVY